MKIKELLKAAREDYSACANVMFLILSGNIKASVDDFFELLEINHTWIEKFRKDPEQETLEELFKKNEDKMCERVLGTEEIILDYASTLHKMPGNGARYNRIRVLASAMKDFSGANKEGWGRLLIG